eukprot:6883388-Prymnesium_polylepis.1
MGSAAFGNGCGDGGLAGGERGEAHRLAQQVSVHNRLHLHDVVVDVALVLDKLVGDLAMQLAEVVRLPPDATQSRRLR